MPIAKATFANPPAFEVRAEVRFPNTLQVADQRHSFHALIKQEFPFVVVPNQQQLQFNFGDYSLHTANQAYRLEISMNYFRLVATRYGGYPEFRGMFVAAFSIFVRHYSISTINDFTLQYKNKLALPSGHSFRDYFRIGISVPEELSVTFHTGKGTLAFEQEDSWVLAEFEPEFSNNEMAAYALNLTFARQRQLVLSSDTNEIAALADKAHTRLTDFFFSILQPQLIEHLKAQ